MANLDTVYDADHRTGAFENHQRGILVCLAGPGTGKTFSLLARSAALTARGCDQDTTCYLTFIKAISSAFIDDYEERFGVGGPAAPRISTLHSFACRILRHQGFRLGYDGDLYFANLAESDDASGTFLTDLLPLVTRDGCRTVPQLRSITEAVKSAWQDDREPAAAGEPVPAIAGDLIRVCRAFRLVDWDHTIPLASALLNALPELPAWLANIRHYFVDEYQDFNRAEQALIIYLSGTAESMVIVGDDDQSLYSGRGGSPDGIRALYADARHDQVSLVKCYRCKSNIVARANTFQARMTAAPRPMTSATAGGQVLCYRFKSSKAEVAFLADYIRSRLLELPDDPQPKHSIVCLFPTKRILACYFDMLSPHVPCSRRAAAVGANRLWLERVLMLLLRPRQRFIERLLLNKYGDVKPRHRKIIVRRIVERDASPSMACESLIAEGCFTGKALTAAQSFVAAYAAIAAKDLPQVVTLIANTLALAEPNVLEQLEVLIAADPADRAELLGPICDALLPDTVTEVPDARSVMFLTIHGSKGLTRRTVVIPGLEEAWLPGCAEPGDLPEKHRLFFVALSRATDNVLLTFPHNRGGTDSLNYPMPGRGEASSFIAAAGLVARYHE